MFCSKCGTELADGSQFCSKCGTKLGDISSTASTVDNNGPGKEEPKLGPNEALCWSCGTVVVKHALTCPKCGQQWPGMKVQKKLNYIYVLLAGIAGIIFAIWFFYMGSFSGIFIFMGIISLLLGIFITAIGVFALITANKKGEELLEEKFKKYFPNLYKKFEKMKTQQ